MGASEIIAVDSDPSRLKMAQRFGATTVVLSERDALAAIREVTEGRGVDVAIEALGTQDTFEKALRSLRPGGTLSSVGVYSGHLQVPLDAIGAGLADHTVVTTLCPGGKERMSRLMRLVRTHRIDLTPLFTHVHRLEDICQAYEQFASRADGVLKIAIRVSQA